MLIKVCSFLIYFLCVSFAQNTDWLTPQVETITTTATVFTGWTGSYTTTYSTEVVFRNGTVPGLSTIYYVRTPISANSTTSTKSPVAPSSKTEKSTQSESSTTTPSILTSQLSEKSTITPSLLTSKLSESFTSGPLTSITTLSESEFKGAAERLTAPSLFSMILALL